ncbi:molybdopterin cofactor-binding domain-containing protein [Aquabacterium sp.]|uniref:xanthine dehydrogenase family protein molybdopterin-binding subunit n=1 Tax=Aquabacterium sp. TaxID=1872578 RepID=UPI003D6D98DA
MDKILMDRRRWIQLAGASGASLLLGLHLPAAQGQQRLDDEAPAIPFNAFVQIDQDGLVTITVHKSEMGQGVHTSLPMLVAEELEVDLSRVKVASAPAHAQYRHTQWGPFQGTGASTSVSTAWSQLRQAGAAAREMLVTAAAQQWEVPVAECTARDGQVVHGPSERRLPYGALVSRASHLPVPANPVLKARADFKLIGQSVKRLDTACKVDGSAVFGIDVQLPDLLIAAIERPPVPGAKAKLAAMDRARVLRLPGVKQVVSLSMGVAVVADSFWTAQQALPLLKIVWSPLQRPELDSELLWRKYRALANEAGTVVHETGRGTTARQADEQVLDLVYEAPYLAHAAMEPLNCTADVRADGCDVWTGSQMQTTDQQSACAITGLPPEKVRIHTTYLGGSFGRRANPHADFVKEAVELSMRLKAPVKVIWSREADMRGGFYRPMHLSRIQATVGPTGRPSAWAHRIVSESIVTGTPFEKALVKHGVDHLSVEGADPPYALPAKRLDVHTADNGASVLWWRSVGHSVNSFAVESALDEVACLTRRDPLALRLDLLQDQPRHAAVLRLVAEKAGWTQAAAPGVHRGLALHQSFGSVVAQVLEITVDKAGWPTVKRVVCAVDCGVVVHPETVKRQVVSGVVYALSAALHGEIRFEQGRVVQSNFHDYTVLRMDDTPPIEVHLLPGDAPPSGVGEVGVPPTAPALTAAYFQATGRRVRRLPLLSHLSPEKTS